MASLVRTAVDIANGRHALSKVVIFALWLADAVLCGLIIWKVPCQSHPWIKIPFTTQEQMKERGAN